MNPATDFVQMTEIKKPELTWEKLLSNVLISNSKFFENIDNRDWCQLRQVSKRLYKSSMEGIMRLLLSHQHVHFRDLRTRLRKYHRMVDTSMMGCGKTYVSCALAKDLNIPITVFAPTQTLPNWKQACKHFQIPFDRLHFHSYSEFQRKVKPYLEPLPDNEKPAFYLEEDCGMRASPEWIKRVKQGTLLVMDESHSLKNVSKRSSLAIILTQALFREGTENSHLLLLSATPFDKPPHAIRLCRVMGIIKQQNLARQDLRTWSLVEEGLTDLKDFCRSLWGQSKYRSMEDNLLRHNYYYGRNSSSKQAFDYIIKFIKPKMMRSMSKVEYTFETDKKNYFCHLEGADLEIVKGGVQQLQRAVAAFAMNNAAGLAVMGMNHGHLLASISKGMKTIEYGKVNTFVKIAKQALSMNPNQKVIIMLNYLEPIGLVTERLKEYQPLVIQGKTAQLKRTEAVEKFQQTNSLHRIIICNLQLLALGVDLDDKDGRFPRQMIVSPSYHVVNLHQATGRVLRSDTKSKPYVRFLYIAQVSSEVRLLDRLAIKSNVIKSGLNYQVNLPGDYKKIYERPCDIPPE